MTSYGCVHSDYEAETPEVSFSSNSGMGNLPRSSGWISMNMLRDLAGFYRGIDLRGVSERYWDWQTTVNCQETRLFFETFRGNFLHYYPRGVAYWGVFDAVAGVAIDKVRNIQTQVSQSKGIKVPLMYTANWLEGSVTRISE